MGSLMPSVGGDPSPDLCLVDFDRLISSHIRKSRHSEPPKFVKRLEDVLEVALPPEETIRVALSLADRALIGQFTGLWPSPKTTDSWVQRNWRPLISKNVASYSVGRGYFLFNFESKEDKDLIFSNGPYFMGPQGITGGLRTSNLRLTPLKQCQFGSGFPTSPCAVGILNLSKL